MCVWVCTILAFYFEIVRARRLIMWKHVSVNTDNMTVFQAAPACQQCCAELLCVLTTNAIIWAAPRPKRMPKKIDWQKKWEWEIAYTKFIWTDESCCCGCWCSYCRRCYCCCSVFIILSISSTLAVELDCFYFFPLLSTHTRKKG